MKLKDYSHLQGSHSFLSPSKYYWLRYSEDKLKTTYENYKKAALGTRYHALAAKIIELSVRQPNTSASFNSFVNDAIGFRMTPEIIVYYSPNCYGTADAISFNDGILRIHDLKTGITQASIDQLMIYAGLFVLDYSVDKRELKETVLRIYQNGEITEYYPSVEEVFEVVDKIITADKIIHNIENGAL